MSYHETIEQVRKRPGMYVGNLKEAGVIEVVRYLIDSVQAGSSATISELGVVLSDGKMEIDVSFEAGAEMDTTFLNEEHLTWELCVCIGLCSSLECIVHAGNRSEQWLYEHGELISKKKSSPEGGVQKLSFKLTSNDSYALLSFRMLDFYRLASILKLKAVCEPQTRCFIEGGSRTSVFRYPEGVKDLMKEEYWFAANRYHWNEAPKVEEFIHTETNETIKIYKLSDPLLEPGVRGIVNGMMINEGTHMKGLNNALAQFPGLKESSQLVILLELNDPRFSAPTKSVLANAEIEEIVENLFLKGISGGESA